MSLQLLLFLIQFAGADQRIQRLPFSLLKPFSHSVFKQKEALYIKWEISSLNQQLGHLDLSLSF